MSIECEKGVMSSCLLFSLRLPLPNSMPARREREREVVVAVDADDAGATFGKKERGH